MNSRHRRLTFVHNTSEFDSPELLRAHLFSGITSSKTVRLMSSTIEAGSSLHQTITLVARSSGIKEIVAQLHTRQLQNVTGSAIITVLPE